MSILVKRRLQHSLRAFWIVTLLYLLLAQLANLSHFQALSLYPYNMPTTSTSSSHEELVLQLLSEPANDHHQVRLSKNNTSKLSSTEQHHIVPHYNHTFPRWGPEGIDLEAVLEFMFGLLDPKVTTLPDDLRRSSDYFPETPYIFDQHGVWVSKAIRGRTAKHQIPHRVVPSEMALKRAWRHLKDYNSGKMIGRKDTRRRRHYHPWPNLQRVVTLGVGFPMIVWHGDYKYCNRHNYQRTNETTVLVSSIPLFTTCAPVNCTHAFPFPTYKTIAKSQEHSSDWYSIFVNHSQQYPWHSKIRKLVWRGSLSGPVMNYTSARSRIGIFAGRYWNHSLLDIGLNKLPNRHYDRETNEPKVNLTVFGGGQRGEQKVLVPSMPQHDFAKYVAILDTDGNSWSSRFGGLLCYNSLIVKVEPHYVDSFYRYLKPWKHYVPVRYDLSDLLEKVEWVMDPNNEAAVRTMIRTANKWCQVHMTDKAISVDILDILNDYVGYLDLHSPSWMEMWNASKARFFEPDSLFGMHKLSMPELINTVPMRMRRRKKLP